MLLDSETLHRFAGLGDTVNHPGSPAGFNPDNNNRSDIRISTGTDQSAKVQLQIFAELQPAIMMRQGQGALNVIGDRFTGGVGKIVQRQNYHMVAYANPAVLAAVSKKM